jgi:hypothetical protein
MYNLVWQSVMCRPGKLLILLLVKNQMLRPTAPAARRRSSSGENAPPGLTDFRPRLTPAFRQLTPAHSHPDCRLILTLIVAQQSTM